MKKDAIRMFFRSILTKFGQVETEQGTLYFDGEEITVGTPVKVEAPGEETIEYVDAPDGQYIAGEITYTVEAGVVTAIDKPEEEPAPETVETEMEGEAEGDVVADAADMVAETVEEETPEFDAEAAYTALAMTMAELVGRVDTLQESVNALLAQPGTEDVFEQFSKVNKSTKQINSIFKVNR